MRLFFSSLILLLLVLMLLGIGCSTVSADECSINTSGGFGGSGPIPIGAGVGATTGDFPADPPRRPLDFSEDANPCIMPPTLCNGKCLDAYEASAIACGKTENKAQRKTCQDDAYAAYKSCVQSCQQMSTTCTDMYVACTDMGMPCTREIEWKKSLCAICLNDCKAKRSYKYNECYQCGFE